MVAQWTSVDKGLEKEVLEYFPEIGTDSISIRLPKLSSCALEAFLSERKGEWEINKGVDSFKR